MAVNAGLTDTLVCALVTSDTNIFAGTVRGGVFRSTNSGVGWTAVKAA